MKISSLILGLSLVQSASAVSPETMARLKKIYPNQSQSFIESRLAEASDPHMKWRSFPPYYWDLLKRSSAVLGAKFADRKGLCAGDSHFENFGFIYNGSVLFSVNDLDDVSMCSLNGDALRLFISHTYASDVKGIDWFKAYQAGVGGSSPAMPSYISSLEKDAKKDGNKLPKKILKMLNEGCSGEYAPATKADSAMIKTYVASENAGLVVVCERVKNSGGSAGLKRFAVILNKLGNQSAIELKPLVSPAPQWDSNFDIPTRKKMFENAVQTYFGANYSNDYFAVTMNGVLYQRRPLKAGNAGVKLDDVGAKDAKDVALYEAQTLGLRHRQTNAQALTLNPADWERWGKAIKDQWEKELR
jgi:hypothetical protein